jgi:KDO2-lipid IV(A) lauroyltransferase
MKTSRASGASRQIAEDRYAAEQQDLGRPAETIPRRWTLHGLNNGVIFRWTVAGVGMLPRAVSYAIGHAGTWLAWRLMPSTRAAMADNLRALFPDEDDRALERRSLQTLRAYARDVIDFLRALDVPDDELPELFDIRPEDVRLFQELLSRGRGIILVTGHYGNWELGGVHLRSMFDLPLTIVAMAEANPEVNRLRREIRERLGADTIEVRQSLDTALQIRRQLGENRVVAMLMDRHLGRDRVEVSLLGRRAWFLRTPALMSYLTGAPLLPCFIERTRGSRFSVTPGTPIVVSRERPREEALRDAAQQFADQLSARIRRRPHYWYQFYSYWKAQDDSYDELA